MKKFFLIAAIVLVASAACTKIETATPDQKISFNAANFVPQTRANVSLKADTETFKSKAYLHAVGVQTVQDFFGTDGETITYNGSDAWLPSRDYYWPKSADSYINFVSWFTAGSVTSTVTETSIKFQLNNLSATDNVMWADEAWGYKQNAETYKFDGVTEGVPTLFHHALSKIAINAKVTKASEGNTTWDVTLENITLDNIFLAAHLELANTAPAAADMPTTVAYTTSGWVGDNSAGFGISNSSVLTTTNAEVLAERSVIPMDLARTTSSATIYTTLNFKVRIVTKYDGTQYSEEVIPMSVKLSTLGTTPITAWEMNTKYIYNIEVNPETQIVKFDPAVIDWTEVTAPTIEVK